MQGDLLFKIDLTKKDFILVMLFDNYCQVEYTGKIHEIAHVAREQVERDEPKLGMYLVHWTMYLVPCTMYLVPFNYMTGS